MISPAGWEIKLLHWFRKNRSHVWSLKVCTAVISRRIVHDIFLIVPIVGVILLLAYGFAFTWIILLGAAAQRLIDALPYDARPIRGALSRPSKSMLCSEAYWASLVFIFISFQRSTALVYPCIGAATFVGLTRIIASSHFPHQVVIGWVFGVLINAIWSVICRVSFRRGSPSLHFNIVGTLVLSGLVLLGTMLRVEDNTHEYVGIRKNEYLDVLRTIVRRSDATNSDAFYGDRVKAQRNRGSRDDRAVGRDSFVILAQNLRERRRLYRHRGTEVGG